MKTQEIVEIKNSGAASEFFVFTTARRAVDYVTNRGLATHWVNVGSLGVRYYFDTAEERNRAVVSGDLENNYRVAIRTAFFNVELA